MNVTPKEAASTLGLTVTWLVLLAFSLLNFYMGEVLLSGQILAFAIFAAVFLKLALVLAVFMELGHRGSAWLLPVLALLLVVLTALAFVF